MDRTGERDLGGHRFGVSTHLFHGERLSRDHLVEIAAHGFEAVEVFATRSHFDYHDPSAVEALAEWLDDTRLSMYSLHAPVTASFVDGVWGEAFSFAAKDESRRRRALDEIDAVLRMTAAIPYRLLVLHLGVTSEIAGDNDREVTRRSLELLHERAAAAGVQLALEVIPNALSSPEALVRLLEEDLEANDAGICFDVGHAHMLGDAVEAIETCSGHLLTTHLHDNQGRTDDHLVPYEGSIDWDGVLLALQKVGYDGPWMFEVANTGSVNAVLERAARARRKFEASLVVDQF